MEQHHEALLLRRGLAPEATEAERLATDVLTKAAARAAAMPYPGGQPAEEHQAWARQMNGRLFDIPNAPGQKSDDRIKRLVSGKRLHRINEGAVVA